MVLRKLRIEDTLLMLEWMHDENVTKFMQKDFRQMTEADCNIFINNSVTDIHNIHYAITNNKDQYIGTISLKNIRNRSAEFAITMRTEAMGKGIAIEAMNQMLKKGFKDLGLQYIYWYVLPENERAIRFYDKNGFKRTDRELIRKIKGDIQRDYFEKFIWYLEENEILL